MFFDNGDFSSGTIFLSIDEGNKTVVFRMSDTKPNGTKIKINYEGPAEQTDDFADPHD